MPTAASIYFGGVDGLLLLKWESAALEATGVEAIRSNESAYHRGAHTVSLSMRTKLALAGKV